MWSQFFLKCNDCESIHEGAGCRLRAGDESLYVCPDCRSVENMSEVEACTCNPTLNDNGKKGCEECEARGWVKV